MARPAEVFVRRLRNKERVWLPSLRKRGARFVSAVPCRGAQVVDMSRRGWSAPGSGTRWRRPPTGPGRDPRVQRRRTGGAGAGLGRWASEGDLRLCSRHLCTRALSPNTSLTALRSALPVDDEQDAVAVIDAPVPRPAAQAPHDRGVLRRPPDHAEGDLGAVGRNRS